MKAKVKLLNVKDGDAIIIQLERNDETLLIVIDGGDTPYSKKVIENIETACTALKKQGPDLLICTHYDSDHIAGIIRIVDKFKDSIGEIWVHKPAVLSELSNSMNLLIKSKNNKKLIRDFTAETTNTRYTDLYLENRNLAEEFKLIIESIGQLNKLLQLIEIYNIPNKEPIANECNYKDWPEIKVLGPTRDYYDSVFEQSATRSLDLLNEDFDYKLLEIKKLEVDHSIDPCSSLKTTSNITATNKASAIISINIDGKKLLFTADAGIESLKSVINFPDSISNVDFLKIPHHGSNNNISCDLIDIISPKTAYNSGFKYEDQEVIDCLKSRNVYVKTTKQDGDLEYIV